MVNASRLLLAVLILASPGFAQAAEDEVAELVDHVIDAYGGEAALDAAQSFRQSGETVSFLRGGAKGRIVRTFQAPDRLRVEIVYPGEAPEMRVLDGDRGWQQGQEAPPALVDAMRLQAARLALPLLLRDAGRQVKDLGTTSAQDGRSVRSLGLALAGGLALFVDIEVPGYRILSSRGLMRRAGTAMEFGAVYHDFRRLSGVLVPGREEQHAMGQHIGYTVIEKNEILHDLDPASFRP